MFAPMCFHRVRSMSKYISNSSRYSANRQYCIKSVLVYSVIELRQPQHVKAWEKSFPNILNPRRRFKSEIAQNVGDVV